MDFEATACITVTVRYSADVDELGDPELAERGNGKTGIADPAAHEKRAAKVERQRITAAKNADRDLRARLTKALAGEGQVVDVVLKEVRQL